MAVAFHSDSIEIQEEEDYDEVDNATPEDDVKYENVETKTSAPKHPQKKSGWCKLVGLVVGLLCGVQALLNIGLRLSLNSEPINNLTNLAKDLDLLLSKYNNLTKDLDIITAEKVQIQSGYDQLQSKYDNLAKDLDIITAEKVQIQSNITELKWRLCELSGWQPFGSSCYYKSTEGKTWAESMQWCRDNQAGLIIINSKEEQDFFRDKGAWLGLTDREKEGVWKWIDGKPLTSPTYWKPGEPNDGGGGGRGEDCAVNYGGSGWWDEPCTAPLRWMCEKAL